MTGDLFAPRAPYTVSSETSGQAARSLTVRQLQRYQRIVLEVICNDLGNGCTDEEIVARTGLLANTVRPRRAELVERAVDHWRRHRNSSGCSHGC